jgi:putative transposase
MGKRPELTGGGLVRSVGGWLNLMEMRRAKVFVKGDERILGEGDFVEQILQEAGEAFERKSLLKSQGWDLDKLAAHVAKLLGIEVSVVWSAGKYRHTVEARSLLCYWAVRDLGVSMTSLANRLSPVSPIFFEHFDLGGRISLNKLIQWWHCHHKTHDLEVYDDTDNRKSRHHSPHSCHAREHGS